MRFGYFKLIEDVVDVDTIVQLKAVNQPKYVPKMRCIRFLLRICAIYQKAKEKLSCRLKTAENLDGLSIGEMLLISSLSGEALVYAIFRILYDFEPSQVDRLQTEHVFGTINFVRTEMECIGKLFAAVKIEPRPEEERAGVSELGKNSILGMIDYIAKRQNISLDDAAKMRWKTVLDLLRIDKEAELYRRRLEAEYRKKA